MSPHTSTTITRQSVSRPRFTITTSFSHLVYFCLTPKPYINQSLELEALINHRLTFAFCSIHSFSPLNSLVPLIPLSSQNAAMADAKTQIESMRKWVIEHKLRTVGKFIIFYTLFFVVRFSWSVFWFTQGMYFMILGHSVFDFIKIFYFEKCLIYFWFRCLWWFWNQGVCGLVVLRVRLRTIGLDPTWRPVLRSFTPGKLHNSWYFEFKKKKLNIDKLSGFVVLTSCMLSFF